MTEEFYEERSVYLRKVIRSRGLAALSKGLKPLDNQEFVEDYLSRLANLFPDDLKAYQKVKGIQRFYITLLENGELEESFLLLNLSRHTKDTV